MREDIGLKSYKVADRLGISQRQLIRIENGEATNIDAHKNNFAKIYNKNIEEINNAWEESKDGRNTRT